MKKIALFFTAIFLLMTGVMASAQDMEVHGTVVDASTGAPVPFASILVQGTMTGLSTDADGRYTITVDASAVLVFSSVGYETKEVAVAHRNQVDCALNVDTTTLDDVVVVAFGTSTKESFTGSATVIKADDIAKVQTSDVTRALEGVVAGVQMTTSSGTLGTAPSIRIRGTSSISAGNAPLYVIDGVPYSGDMNNINPADIESMTVLKDAASNALYGSRGANGVIMITTKKAKAGDAVVNVDAKWGWNTKALKEYDYITNPAQYYETHYGALYSYYTLENGMSHSEASLLASQNVAGSAKNGGLGYQVYTVPEGQSFIGLNGKVNPNAELGRKVLYDGQEYLLTPDNWLDETYRQSLRQEYNVSVSGTTGKASFFASIGYLNNKGIVDGSDMYRYSARLRAEYQAKKWLKVGGNMAYTRFNWNNGTGSAEGTGNTGDLFSFATNIAPIYPVYIRDGEGNIMLDSRGMKRYDYGNGGNAGMSRPVQSGSNALQAATLDKNNSEGNALNGTGFAEVTFLKDFKFTVNAGFGLDETRSTNLKNMYFGQWAPTGGALTKAHARSTYINLQQLLSWDRTFAGEHHLGILLGHEYYRSDSYSLSGDKSKLFSMDNTELNGAVIDGQNSSSTRSTYNNEGYFVRAQYDFANRLFLSASYRRDASSKFHPDHRWGNFWSVGAGWLINQEPWFNASWIDMLKLKASFGSQGNDGISSYLYTDQYAITNNEGEIAVTFQSKGNENITWETNSNFNTGVDFEFWKGRLSGTVEYFYRKTSDMLFFFTVPSSLGYSGYYDNIGDMRNSGVEIAINANIFNERNFRWDVYANATHYTNKITMLPAERKTRTIEGYQGYATGNKFVGEGLPLHTFLIPKYAGIDHEDGKPMWYMDVTDDQGNVTGRETTKDYAKATDYLCGDPVPDVYGGFGTSLQFYGFDVAVSFTYSIGGLTYDSGYASLVASPAGSIGGNYHKDVLNAWTPENKSSDFPRFTYQDQYTASSSDRFLVDASYLNLQNAQIGYTFPEKWMKRLHVSRLRLYVTCDNIWYWSKRQGLDPRQSFTGATNSMMSSPVRTLSGGINLTF